jgi:hypothetical protein
MENTKIKLTRTILDKPYESLTKEEKIYVDLYNTMKDEFNNKLETENNIIKNECKILCSGYEKNPIPDYGWINPIKELCYKLEGLNFDYSKWGIRVVLDQAKEKYATLRFYTHIESDELGFIGFINRHINSIINFLDFLNYGIKYVVKVPGYIRLEWKELTKEQFDSRKDEYDCPLSKNNNQVIEITNREVAIDFDNIYIINENGRFFYSRYIHHLPEKVAKPTKHRILFRLKKALNSFSYWISTFYKEPLIQRIKTLELDYKVDELIRKAERECAKLCQHCGLPFSNNYKPKCTTLGWFMHLCEDCAMITGMDYRKNNAIYKEGQLIEEKTTNGEENED